ncbi:Two-component sensor histidine kinase, contains HisKA and HATPase domains [Chitinophaga eiseniae]|uniref:histidine kinase n=1 Tax=Chitinophaga eiseniae TaxID=634771 RepID=A0A1T4LVT7_9BACT|nr:histidine kinase dimerization/phosphoacceptor domain -containing protein [Chitinophaga eiseniae]SJZ58795.1 Two-component sensor histidine kinase, contains HisKA and HATPase domains [Chitinophaga eiseniae]
MFQCMINSRQQLLLLIYLLMPAAILAQADTDTGKAGELLRNGKADTATIHRMLRVGEAFLDKPESREEDMNMGFRMAEEMESRSRKINYLRGLGLSKLLRAKAFRESGQAEKGRTSSEQALQLLTQVGTAKEKAQAIIELGGTYSNNAKDLPRKIALYQQGADIFLENGDELSAAQLKEFIGDLLQVNGNYTDAEQVLQEALSIYKKKGYERLQGLYSILGEAYHGSNNFVQSLRYNLLAVETAEKMNEQGPLMTTIYNRVGLNYYSVHYYDQAFDYFDKALAHARYLRDTGTVRTLLLNMSDALRHRGEYSRSLDTLSATGKLGPITESDQMVQANISYLKNYMALDAWQKAAPHYEYLKKIPEDDHEDKGVVQAVRLAIAGYLQAAGQFSKAEKYVRDYQRGMKEAPGGLVRQSEGEYLAFRADSATGNLASAITHYQRFKQLSDSVTGTNQSKQLDVLRLQFETERKDKDIELLTQKSKLQEISLQKGRVFRNVIMGGIAMLLLILALLYNRYRLKKRNAFRLEKQREAINAQNELLKKLVDEKEWLLKEIHHRVKNNLQIIISLLNTQSRYLDNADALAAIKNSQHRMYAMSLIHQRLYHTDNLGAIDMHWYIRELTGFMQESFDTDSKITFRINSEAIQADVVQAVPLGLILNEAVSNAIKYAFPGDRRGVVEITFKKNGAQYYLLSIADDGIGLRDAFLPEESGSLGMSLMKGLAEQLEGSFHLNSTANGVTIQVLFSAKSIHPTT